MKKSEAQILGAVVLIGIIVYPFVWLHEKVGWGGIIVLGVIALSGFVFWSIRRSRKDEEEFNKLILYVLHNQMAPNEARKLNNSLAKVNLRRSALIRRLQILRDSIDISLSSKKRETAESRMAEVKSSYEEIRKEYADLMTHETILEIDRVVSDCVKQFNTNLYTNIARAHIEKAEKLKTVKSKKRYAALAMEAIQEGLLNPNSEKQSLERWREKIDQFIRSLEKRS